jgi:hypothetical protein
VGSAQGEARAAARARAAVAIARTRVRTHERAAARSYEPKRHTHSFLPTNFHPAARIMLPPVLVLVGRCLVAGSANQRWQARSCLGQLQLHCHLSSFVLVLCRVMPWAAIARGGCPHGHPSLFHMSVVAQAQHRHHRLCAVARRRLHLPCAARSVRLCKADGLPRPVGVCTLIRWWPGARTRTTRWWRQMKRLAGTARRRSSRTASRGAASSAGRARRRTCPWSTLRAR